ncbi:MAG TPA: DMT family transporter [Candidatus Cloacimonetes bacterium]|nr:DMT family transporter [Candidatus Cloacimonadota bacterium]
MNELLLIITAALWGFAFVAQRKGMESLDAFSFNAMRFALGAVVVRLALFRSFKGQKKIVWQLGVVLFFAAAFQQVGIIYTTAGAAGFITGLYVLFVPIFGLWRGQKLELKTAVAIALSLGGLYLINSGAALQTSFGNLLVFISAIFFALHMQLVDKYSKIYPAGVLAFSQFTVASSLSVVAAILQRLILGGVAFSDFLIASRQALIPVLYGGIFSAGIAYTLQIKAQQKAAPSAAAVIMCLEGVFAMIGGALLLSEKVSLQALGGAFLLLAAMILVSFQRNMLTKKPT